MHWSFESLWQKTKLFAQRGLNVDQSNPLFPFWMSLALETLARAALAKVHPVLLADPQAGGGDSVWYALGYESAKPPKSILTKTVLARCRKLSQEFTAEEENFCLGLTDLRNRELHTGEPVFEKYPSKLWLGEYYRVCKILVGICDKDLIDLLGPEEGKAAEQMVGQIKAAQKKEVLDLVAGAKKLFDSLSPEEQQGRRAIGEERIAQIKRTGKLSTTTVECPSCGATAIVTGELTRSATPQLNEDYQIVEEHTFIPVLLGCPICELKLEGHGSLHAAGVGGLFTAIQEHDPVEFHGIDPYELVDYDEVIRSYADDYGND